MSVVQSSGSAMDRAVITAFARAILDTFRTMLAIDVRATQVRDLQERIPGEGVHAIIGMNGEVEGACALTLRSDAAIRITGSLLDEEITEVDRLVVDAVQEINNVAIGAAKKYLSAAGLDFAFGLPKTMVGTMFATDEGPAFRNLGIRFQSEIAACLVNLSWKRG